MQIRTKVLPNPENHKVRQNPPNRFISTSAWADQETDTCVQVFVLLPWGARIMLHHGFPIRLILLSLFALGGLVATSTAQDDDSPGKIGEANTEKPNGFSSTIGRIFGRKEQDSDGDLAAKRNESDQVSPGTGPSVPGKPSFGFSRSRTVPAQTTGNRGGGIFVPLKSFTNRVFRGGGDSEVSGISIEHEDDYSKNITKLEEIARNRAMASSDEKESAEDEIGNSVSNPASTKATESESNEVGSALKSSPSQKSPTSKTISPKPSVEPFANSRSASSASRVPEAKSSGQESTSLPPPPSLVPTPSTSQSESTPAPITTSGKVTYPGASSNSAVRSPASTSVVPSTKALSKPPAPNTSGSANLEQKSTSRRTPVGSTGITESLELPDGRNAKPTSLVDLSQEGSTPLPTSISRSRSGIVNSASDNGALRNDDVSNDTPKEDEPIVTRNRVPESRADAVPPTRANNASAASESNGLPQVSTSSNEKPLQRPGAVTQESIDASTGSLLELKQPGITINIAGPNSMVVGQETVYELIAKNNGNSSLNGLIVRLSLPNSVVIGNVVALSGVAQPDREDGENAILWEVETIPAGQSQSLKMPLKTASPEHFAMNVEWTALPQSQSLQVKVHEPKLDLALEGPAEAEYGIPLKYRLRIKNPGNAVAKSVEVMLAAESFGSNQSVVGDIAPGAERIIDVELLFEQGGVIPILATASSSVSQVRSESKIDVRVRQAKLAAKWDGATSYYQGSVADYRLTLSNEGDAAIQQAKCSVNIPNGADLIDMPPGSVRRGSSVQWDVKKLMPGESVAVPFRFTFSQLGQTELALQAEAKNSGAVVARHSINVDAIEDLKLAVIPPVAPAPVGQPVPYEIEIHNRGTKAAANVAVLAQFSEGIEPVKVDGHSAQIVPGQVIFESIPMIGPNERITLKVHAVAGSSGTHRFRAEVKGSSGEADLVQEGSTRYMASGVQPQVRR